MRRLFYLIFFLLVSGLSQTVAQQQIKGMARDAGGKAIASVSISLRDAEGNILSFTRTNEKGAYTLLLKDQKNTGLRIEASSLGYKKTSIQITDVTKDHDLVLEESQIALDEVKVRNRPSLSANGDTLSYRPSDFADKQDRSIGDVLKKMPGIEVAENGQISYNGKAISNLYIDGDNLLDDKYNIGAKAIPQGSVDQVQVIQNDQPIKMMRKNNTSEDVALNLVMKDEARLNVMGEATAGAGTPEKFDGNATAMLFNKNLKFINNLKGNNIGIDPGLDLRQHNQSGYLKRLDNDQPDNLLSTGAAGVPSLPQSRSLFNKAGLINLNNLYKFNEDLLLKANLSYLYDERKQQYNKYSETYLPDQTVSYAELQNNTITPQKLRAQINLNNNTEQHYLNNNFIIDYAPFKASSAFVLNNSPASQLLRQETLDISNEFNYRKKLKSDEVIFMYSYLSKTSRPESLTIAPGLNADVFNEGVPYAGINQYVKQPALFSNNSVAIALVSNRFTQTYKAGFSLQHQQLNSELYSVQNDQSTGLVPQNAVNDLNWFRTKIYGESTYEFTSDRITASVQVPLSYNQINYRDAANDLKESLPRLFADPSLKFKYMTGIENYFSLNYAFNNELGGIDDVYRGTVLRNYRSPFSNNSPILEKQIHNIGGSFNFRKAIQMLFFNLTANYSDAAVNTISSMVLNDNIQQSVALPLSNHIRNWAVDLNASKYLFSLKSTVSAGINFSQSRYSQIQNGKLLPLNSRIINYKAGAEARLTNFVSWSYKLDYSQMDNRAKTTNSVKSSFQQLRQQSTLSFTTLKNVYVNLSAEHLFTQQSAQQDLQYLFADMNITYKLQKMKTDLVFGITNLTNIKTFEAVTLSSNSLTTGAYQIPGRIAMMKATFNF
jgi:hypothetical protein